jgi:hypothetical protein
MIKESGAFLKKSAQKTFDLGGMGGGGDNAALEQKFFAPLFFKKAASLLTHA